MDGDGLPDRVLRVAGANALYVRLNKTGRIGLLKTIHHPQGGTTNVEYAYKGGTTDMPQSKYVMSEVTRHDGQSAAARQERGLAPLGYTSERSWTTSFHYDNGYYDRNAREHYGFEQVTTESAFDKTREIRSFHQGAYYLKNMPYKVESFDLAATWNSVTFYTYREAPVALQTRVATVIKEGGASMSTETRYEYDERGNVTKITELAEGTQALTADIIWWHSTSDYYHSRPSAITVTSGGAVLRERTGTYNDRTGALTSQARKDGKGNDITTSITWDSYGNLKKIESGGTWVEYT